DLLLGDLQDPANQVGPLGLIERLGDLVIELELFLGCLWRLFASRAARAVPLGPQRRPPRVDGRRCKRLRVLEDVDPTVAIPYVSILLIAAPTLAEQCLVDTVDAGVDADLT